jgi:hypothetical protein
MNCPCDTIVFPVPLTIAAGLDELPLQFATFPEFRQAMLDAITREPALSTWRARSSDDFGVMLLEMWAYVCDSIAFYREVIGNEQYVRTAQLRPSLRKLTGLLGYVPRPASSATVDLVALAEGRQPVLLPPGTAFRSGAFPGGAPQVFELDTQSQIHPLLNQWTLARSKPTTIDAGEGYATLDYRYAWALPATVTATAGSLLLVWLADGSAAGAATVTSVTDFPAQDGIKYKQINWSPSLSLPGSTALTNVQLSKPNRQGGLWKQTVQSGDSNVIDADTVVLDGLYRAITPGSLIILQNGSDLRWFRCYSLAEESRKLPKGDDVTYTDPSTSKQTTVSPPYPLVTVTVLVLDADINDPSRKAGYPSWGTNDASNIALHYGFVPAAQVTMPYFTTLTDGDPLSVPLPIEPPADGSSSNEFILEDKNGLGAEISGALNFNSGAVILGQSASIGETLVVPVTMYGNIVTASQGQTVASELLGTGDATDENQSFTLKKKPLTYVPSPTAGNETGVTSTLHIWVNGLQWTEVPSFYGHSPGDQVYIVRENDDSESVVTFNGQLATGVPIVASYRFGAGATSPPAGSITQVAKAVKGLKSVRNPVAAAGGADAEAASNLATNAPKSALLLGRAISIDDMEAAAANVPGVRAVQAQWRWNTIRQRPVIQIWYIGAPGVKSKLQQTLRGLSDPTTPISVDEATPLTPALSISVETDPRRMASDVATAVQAALMDPATGLLAPERIGIGATLFRSCIFEAVLAITGAVAVDGLLWNGAPFDPYGVNPGAGNYFDFENGVLTVNGEADPYVATG